MRTSIDIALLSKYRTQLMGIAMLWVMLRHSEFNDTGYAFIIRLLHRSGYGGVDIFFLLSGLGLFFAYNKEKSIKVFYLRRLLRILPYYIPVVILYTLLFQYPIGEIDLRGVFLRVFLLDYWIDRDALGWYIPVAIFFYFLTPCIMYILKGSWTRNCILLIFAVFVVGFLANQLGQLWIMDVVCVRLASFILGIYTGFIIAEKKQINIVWLVILFIVGAFMYAIEYRYGGEIEWVNVYFVTLPFFFLALPLCAGLSYLFSLFKNYKFPFFYFIGTYTLCIYIFHERIKLIMVYLDLPYIVLISFILSIQVAVIWQNIISKLLKKARIAELLTK